MELLAERVGKLMGGNVPPPLPRDEWDFRDDPIGRLPGWQTDICAQYEACRESKQIRDAIQDWRVKNHQQGKVVHLGQLHYDEWNNGVVGPAEEIEWLLVFPEFPAPWLSIREADRESRSDATGKVFEQRQWTQDGQLVGRGDFPDLTASVESLRNSSGVYVDYQETGPMESCHVFRINWGMPNTKLEEWFSRWLQLYRPAKATAHKRTGRHDSRDDLKTLGAYRLLRHYEWNWILAEDASEAVLGKPLYSGQSAWIAARRRAEQWPIFAKV